MIKIIKINDKRDIKVFILYLLHHVGEPLEFTTVNDMVLQDEFVNYFDFSFCFSELLEIGQIEELSDGDKKLYRITKSGSESLESFESSLLPIIKERALRSALRLIAFNRNGDRIISSITEEGSGYRLKCGMIDKERTLCSIDVYLTDKAYAERLRENFDERAEVIFRGMLSLLSGDVNFLFDE